MTLQMRQLSNQERARAFASKAAGVDLTPYVDAVREMEGDVAYAIPVNGTTARGLKIRFGKAAKGLGLKLKWAKVPKTATEVIVELADA